MTIEQLAEILRSTGLPVTYHAWPVGEAPPLPWICYRFTNTNNFAADNAVHQVINDYDVELYTAEKNPTAEAAVEAALVGLFWNKTETYIESERCFQILYELEE